MITVPGTVATVLPQISEPGPKNLKSLALALMPTSDATSAHKSRLLHPELRFLNLGSTVICYSDRYVAITDML